MGIVLGAKKEFAMSYEESIRVRLPIRYDVGVSEL